MLYYTSFQGSTMLTGPGVLQWKNHSRTLRVYTQGGGILEPSNLRVLCIYIYVCIWSHRYAHTIANSFINATTALKLIHGPLIYFNSWCAALFPTPNQRNWKESWSPLPHTTSDSEAQHQWLTIFWTAYLCGSNQQGIPPMANIRIHLDTKKGIGGVDQIWGSSTGWIDDFSQTFCSVLNAQKYEYVIFQPSNGLT